MTRSELAAIARGVALALRDALAQMVARLDALETKERGLDGAPGPEGKEGPQGVPGRDGQPGQNGLPGWPGKDGADGANGRDGVDGLGFDDFEEIYDGARTFTHRYRSGDRVKEFTHKVPFMLDRGVFRDGVPYETGDSVSFGGSLFIAQRDITAERPEDTSGAWRLAVKRGRDGREGKVGPEGKQGPQGQRGDPGRDYR